MTEEIINSDGSRNWQANILLDNIKRLEQENKQMKSALEEIKKIIKSYDLAVDNGVSVDTLYTIKKIINEVLG